MKPSTEVTRVLEETPNRALEFLRGAGLWISIRKILASRGYTDAEHEAGWSLLLNCSNFNRKFDHTEQATEVREAMIELDATDEPLFRRSRASLDRFHPERAAFVFDGLEPSTEMGAVVSMSKFLGRLDALENSPEREATRTADHAALAILESRGLTKAERVRLAGRVAVAMTGNSGEAASPDEIAEEQKRVKDLIALRAWYVEWAEMARAVIKRRDQLVRLGLARRKRSKDLDAPEPPVPALPAVPAPARCSEAHAATRPAADPSPPRARPDRA